MVVSVSEGRRPTDDDARHSFLRNCDDGLDTNAADQPTRMKTGRATQCPRISLAWVLASEKRRERWQTPTLQENTRMALER